MDSKNIFLSRGDSSGGSPSKKRDFYHIVFIPNQWYKPPHIVIWQKPPITWMKSLTEQDSEGFPTGENAGVLANFNDR